MLKCGFMAAMMANFDSLETQSNCKSKCRFFGDTTITPASGGTFAFSAACTAGHLTEAYEGVEGVPGILCRLVKRLLYPLLLGIAEYVGPVVDRIGWLSNFALLISSLFFPVTENNDAP